MILCVLLLGAPARGAQGVVQIYGLDPVMEGDSTRIKVVYTDYEKVPQVPSLVSAEVRRKSDNQLLYAWSSDQLTPSPTLGSTVYIPLSPQAHRNLSGDSVERHRVEVVAVLGGEPVVSVGEYDVLDVPGKVVATSGALVTPTPGVGTPTVSPPPYGGPK